MTHLFRPMLHPLRESQTLLLRPSGNQCGVIVLTRNDVQGCRLPLDGQRAEHFWLHGTCHRTIGACRVDLA